MGAKQSKRSVDITNSPSKAGEGECAGEGEGRVVKIGDADVKAAATNGTVPHTEKETEVEEKDENAKDQTAEKSIENKEKDVAEVKETQEVKENGVSDSEELKTPDSESTGDNLNETGVSEKSPEAAPEVIEGQATPETKKQKEKKKKKWSFRSISFSKKDKSKPSKDAEKNGDVKEVAEENVEDAKSPTTESPKAEKSETAAEPAAAVLNGEASKEELGDSSKAEATPVEEPKKEEPKTEEIKTEQPKVEEPKIEEPKIEPKVEELKLEPKVVEAVSEPVVVPVESPKSPAVETKEVRNDEVPPPLPSSNPPSSLTAFAESTKADILNTETIDLLRVSTVVSPVLEDTIGEPLYKDEISKLKQKVETPASDIPAASSEQKSEIEPSIKPELTPENQKSNTIVESKPIEKPTESVNLLVQTEEPEPLTEVQPEQNDQPVVQEIISVVSSTHSDNSDPIIADDLVTEPSTIELNLEPLSPAETDQSADLKDLPSKTDLEVAEPQADVSATVDVKESPEILNLVSDLNAAEPKESEVSSQSSLLSNCNKIPVDSSKVVPQLTPIELVIEDAKPQTIEQPQSDQSLNLSEESESIDAPPQQESEEVPVSKSPPAPIIIDECPADLPSPIDIPPPSAAVDPADSLQDISTESLPSLPEPVSENLAEPMSLPPVESVPEPIATDCLPPESVPVTVDSIPVESVPSSIASVPLATESAPLACKSEPVVSDPVPKTDCPPVLTNGSVNGLPSPGEVSPTMNGGSILLAEAALLKQIPQDVPSEIVKEEEDKPAVTAEVAVVEE